MTNAPLALSTALTCVTLVYGAHCAPTTLKDIAESTDHAAAIVSGTCQKHRLFFTNRVRIQDVMFPNDSWGPGFYINPCSRCTSPIKKITLKEQWRLKTLDDLFTHLAHIHKDIHSYQLVLHNLYSPSLSLTSQKISNLDIKSLSKDGVQNVRLTIDACPHLKYLWTQGVIMCPMPSFVRSIQRLEGLFIENGQALFIPPWLLSMPRLEELVLANNLTLFYAGHKGKGRATFNRQDQWAFTPLKPAPLIPVALFKSDENPWNIHGGAPYQAHIQIIKSKPTQSYKPTLQSRLHGLPNEILEVIGSFLKGRDKKNLRLVSHRFASLFWQPCVTLFLMDDLNLHSRFLRLYFKKPNGPYFTSTLITETIRVTPSNHGEFLKIDLSWGSHPALNNDQVKSFIDCGPLYVSQKNDFNFQEQELSLKNVMRQLALIELQPYANALFHYLDIQNKNHLLDMTE
jgi:hypothetical protein